MLVLAAGCGALALVHRDLQAVAENVVSHFHLNPASRFPRDLPRRREQDDRRAAVGLAALAAAYAAVRLAEAYGLWRRPPLGGWLGRSLGRAVRAGRAVRDRFDGRRSRVRSLLTGNLVVVVYLVGQLYRDRNQAPARRIVAPAYPSSSTPGKK